MRRLLIFSMLLLSMGLLSTKAQEKNVRAGIGVSLSSNMTGMGYYYFYGLSWHSIPAISVPIEFGKHFRLEPELGLMQYSTKSESSSGSVSSTDMFRAYRLGFAASYLIPNAGGSDYMQASVGVRFAMHGFHTEDESPSGGTIMTREVDRTDVSFGPFIGAEYFPVKEFSVGGELGLSLIAAGEPASIPEGISTLSPDGLAVGLYGSLNVRWFIF